MSSLNIQEKVMPIAYLWLRKHVVYQKKNQRIFIYNNNTNTYVLFRYVPLIYSLAACCQWKSEVKRKEKKKIERGSSNNNEKTSALFYLLYLSIFCVYMCLVIYYRFVPVTYLFSYLFLHIYPYFVRSSAYDGLVVYATQQSTGFHVIISLSNTDVRFQEEKIKY